MRGSICRDRSTHMNHLLVGTADKTEQLLSLSHYGFLVIDDGPLADAFSKRFPRAKQFDITQHSFNPMRGMDYRRARDFAAALFPDKDLMTYDKGRRALTRLLLTGPTTLSDLPDPSTVKNPWEIEALERVQDLLLSPVVSQVLCRPTNFSFKGSVIVRLDRAQLAEDDARILGSLLIGQSKGQIVLEDFGFYGRPLHMSLIRQNRLTAGVRYLDELALPLRQAVLTIGDKHFLKLLPKDAEELIGYTDNPSGNPKNLM